MKFEYVYTDKIDGYIVDGGHDYKMEDDMIYSWI